MDKKPPWLKKKIKLDNKNIANLKNIIDSSSLHTVCQSAKCPNIYECFSKRTATFMLMGDTCTRNCSFCGVSRGKPALLDEDEPVKIAEAVKEMDLLYTVITSVTRDDLKDGGATHFAKTVRRIKELNPDTRVECLIPDFGGSTDDLKTLLSEDLDVLNHNIETIKNNYSTVRSGADYSRSLELLKKAKKIKTGLFTKSGFMVGLGEDMDEIEELLKDLKNAEIDIVTIGQYLSPSDENIKISKYYTPGEFKKIESIAKKLGFMAVSAGPFVRSSYGAELVLNKALKK